MNEFQKGRGMSRDALTCTCRLVGNSQRVGGGWGVVGQGLCRQGNAQTHRQGKPGAEGIEDRALACRAPGGSRTHLDSCVQRNIAGQTKQLGF